MSNRDKMKQAGKELFMLNIPSHEIARILDVSQTTVSNWTTGGGWHAERAELISQRKSRVDSMGELIDYQLEAMRQRVRINRKKVTENPDQPLPLIDKGEVDALAKMFASIKGKELVWSNYVSIIRDLANHLADKAPDLAKAITPFIDEYLMARREGVSA